MHERQGCTETDSKQDEPPAWAVLDIGTDSSNFAITNGCSVFVRSIPLGGNDLTRALAKRYQLNPAHAEKLKRNPTKAPLLHQMYEALEPSFRNLAIEVQRSIDQYRSTEINPAIQQLYVRGGGLKLHGLLRAILYARANQEIA